MHTTSTHGGSAQCFAQAQRPYIKLLTAAFLPSKSISRKKIASKNLMLCNCVRALPLAIRTTAFERRHLSPTPDRHIHDDFLLNFSYSSLNFVFLLRLVEWESRSSIRPPLHYRVQVRLRPHSLIHSDRNRCLFEEMCATKVSSFSQQTQTAPHIFRGVQAISMPQK